MLWHDRADDHPADDDPTPGVEFLPEAAVAVACLLLAVGVAALAWIGVM